MATPFYAVIMAGGSGTRLWPLSRKSSPKQLLSLTGERSLFQLAVDRLLPLLAPENILVVTTDELGGKLAEQSPQLPAESFIIEPEGRGTAPVIGLAAHVAETRAQGEAVIACLTADHYIKDVERFRRALTTAVRLAADGTIVTLGIKPTFASTGFGYIERGVERESAAEFRIFDVVRFIEKPARETALEFVADEKHAWNSGMFVWRTSRVIEEFARQLPATASALQSIRTKLGSAAEQETMARLWPTISRETIDFGIMEHADNVAVIPIDVGWSDVGNWASLLDILPPDECGNVVLDAQHFGIDTERTLVKADRLVATIGLRDTIIVDTPDALLVCAADRAQDVKQVVERLQKNGKNYL